MDGPAAGGGIFDLGGTFVRVGTDLGDLRTGFSDAQRMTADFEQKYGKMTIKLVIDTLDAGKQLSQFAAAIQAAPPFQLKAAFDTSALQTQFQQAGQQFVASFATASQQAAQQLATAIQQALNNVQLPGGGGGGGGGSSTNLQNLRRQLFQNTAFASQFIDTAQQLGWSPRGGGGGGGGGGMGLGRSPLSIYGLARRLGVGLGPIVAAVEGLNFTTALADAGSTESHPERILREYDQPFSQFKVAGDPTAQAQAQAIASGKAQLRMQQFFESVPLLGNVAQAWNALSGTKGEVQDREFAAQRNIQSIQFLDRANYEADIRGARVGGNPADVLRAAAEARQKPLADVASTLPALMKEASEKIEADYAAGHRGQGYEGAGYNADAARNSIDQVDPILAGRIEVARRAAAELAKEKAVSDAEIAHAQGAYVAQIALTSFSGDTARQRAGGFNLLAEGGTGASAAALKIQQDAAMKAFDDKSAADRLGLKNDTERSAFDNSRSGERAELEAKHRLDSTEEERKRQQFILRAQEDGQAALLHSARQFYAERLQDLKDSERRELDAIRNGTKEQKDAVKEKFKEIRQAMSEEATYDAQQSRISGNAQVRSADLRGNNQPFAASVADFDEATRQQLSGIDISDPKGTGAQKFIDAFRTRIAQRRSITSQQGFRTQSATLSYQAQQKAAQQLIAQDSFGASMTEFEAGQRNQIAGIEDPNERAAATAAFKAQDDAARIGHARELSNRVSQMDVETKISEDRANHMHFMPGARAALLRAQLLVANASPEEKEYATRLGKAQLHEMETEMAPHSGGFSIAAGRNRVIGDPLNLSHTSQDRGRALAFLRKGQKDLNPNTKAPIQLRPDLKGEDELMAGAPKAGQGQGLPPELITQMKDFFPRALNLLAQLKNPTVR
jgi:hypothetical protein